MIEPLESSERAVNAWLERWSRVVLSPRTFFLAKDRKTRGTVQFFVINQVLAYVSVYAVAVGFFFVYWRHNLLAHVRTDLGGNLAAASALFLAYVILNFIVLIVSALCSWAIARILKSNSSFPRHLGVVLELSALEPLATAAAGLLVLCGGEYGQAYVFLGGGALLLARGWMAWAGYWAIMGVHRLQPVRHWVVYLFGFFLQQIVLTSACLALTWTLIGMVIIPTWD